MNVNNFNREFNFENFVVGNCNEMAYKASMKISKQLNESDNLVYIYGDNGIGKTHLLQAIGNDIRKIDGNKNVLYVTSDTIINDITKIKENNTIDRNIYINTYDSIDILLLDDVQFLLERNCFQEMLFSILSKMNKGNKKVILTGEKPLKFMSELEEQISSNFKNKTFVEIFMPDYRTKLAILKKYIERFNLDINLDTKLLQKIASCNGLNIRDIEGIINKIYAYCNFNKCSVTEQIVDDCLNSYK